MNVSRFTHLAILLIAVPILAACAQTPSAAPTVASTKAPIAVPTLAPTTAPALAPTLAPALAPTSPAAGPTVGATAAAPNRLTITLGPGRDATQPGTATLEAQGDKTQVTLELSGSTPGVAQPAHIHDGTCPGVGPVKYPLSNVVDGKSVTVINVSLADLLKGTFAINVHKSTTEAGVYVACAPVAQK